MIAIASSFLLYLPHTAPLFVGNLSMYVMSYIKARVGSIDVEQGPWLFYSYVGSWGVGTVLVSVIKQHFREKIVRVVAICFHAGGIFLSYFTVKISVSALCVTFGVVSGIGGGLLSAHSIPLVIPWVEKRMGLVSAFICSSPAVFSLVMNQVITLYINPDNKVPDEFVSGMEYFTQTEILDRVPYVFLYIGGITMATICLGFVLIQEKRETVIEDNEVRNSIQLKRAPLPFSASSSSLDAKSNDRVKDGVNDQDQEFSIRLVLTSRKFYVACIAHTVAVLNYTFILKYYKIYALTTIKDDHFLTNLGVVLSFTLIISGPVWGAVIDRIGLKQALVILFTVESLVYAWLSFTIVADPWLYCLAVGVLWNVGFVQPIVHAIFSMKLFGEQHYLSVYSLMTTTVILTALGSPAMLGLALEHLQWAEVFCGISCLGIITLVCVIVYFPQIH